MCEKEKNSLQSFSLLLVLDQVTLCDPLGGLSVREKEEVFFFCSVGMTPSNSKAPEFLRGGSEGFVLDFQTVLPN